MELERKSKLTNRQRQILYLVCEGKPCKMIGRELGLSELTVRNYLVKIYSALGAFNKSHALYLAIQKGEIDFTLQNLPMIFKSLYEVMGNLERQLLHAKKEIHSVIDGEIEPLTPKETEVLKLIIHGRTNVELANELFISPQTVKNHVSSIIRKLNAKNRTHAAIISLQQGFIVLDVPTSNFRQKEPRRYAKALSPETEV